MRYGCLACMRQRFAWLPAKDSFQWAHFERLLDVLEGRRNDVFVVVGPFNEHLLVEESRAGYEKLLREIGTRLRERNTAHFAFSLLPTHLYADASHPLAAGYARLAQELMGQEAFQRFLGR